MTNRELQVMVILNGLEEGVEDLSETVNKDT